MTEFEKWKKALNTSTQKLCRCNISDADALNMYNNWAKECGGEKSVAIMEALAYGAGKIPVEEFCLAADIGLKRLIESAIEQYIEQIGTPYQVRFDRFLEIILNHWDNFTDEEKTIFADVILTPQTNEAEKEVI